MINSLSSFFDEHEALANNILVAFVLACVQTSPLPQKKIGRRVFSPDFFCEGAGTSVHRLLLFHLKLDFIKRRVAVTLSL